MFNNRADAAQLLIKKLEKYRSKELIIAGIPRGALPMAKIIADHLGAPLTAILVHKIPSPESGELAVGCVGLSGNIHQLAHAETYGASSSYIQEKAREEFSKLQARKERYHLTAPDFKHKTVILVDDGIATGATSICAVQEVRSQGAQKIILATPVSSLSAAKELRPLVDEFIALYVPDHMFAIGEFYQHFEQIEDEEAMTCLHSSLGSQETLL